VDASGDSVAVVEVVVVAEEVLMLEPSVGVEETDSS
jgi:hypothetical protein